MTKRWLKRRNSWLYLMNVWIKPTVQSKGMNHSNHPPFDWDPFIRYEACTDPNMMNKLKKSWQNEMVNSTFSKNEWSLQGLAVSNLQQTWKSMVIPAFYSVYQSLEECKLSLLNNSIQSIVHQEIKHNSNLLSKSQDILDSHLLMIDPKTDAEKYISSFYPPEEVNHTTMAPLDEFPIDTSKPFQIALFNILQKNMKSFHNLERPIISLDKEIFGLYKLFTAYSLNPSLGDPDTVYDGNYLFFPYKSFITFLNRNIEHLS